MTKIKRTFMLGSILLSVALNGNVLAYAQTAPQTSPSARQELLQQVQQALRDVRHGDLESVMKIKEEQGDQALRLFADARFDPDIEVRRAVMDVASDNYASLLFLLPMVEDSNLNVAVSVVSRIVNVKRPVTQFQQLDAPYVVRLIKRANAKNPDFIIRSPEILLLLSQFKQNPQARALAGQLVKTNRWDVSTATGSTVEWNNQHVTALLARQAIGSLSTVQVLKVLKTYPKARVWFLEGINFLTDETLLRYALSLMQDTTLISPGSEDVGESRISSDSITSFSWATGKAIDYTMINGVPKFDKKTMQRVFAFYGLQMFPDEEARLVK